MYFFLHQYKYQVGDWVKQYGLPQHHLRVVEQGADATTGRAIYRVFDTRLARSYADYEWVWAEALEINSEPVMRAQNSAHVSQILYRCQILRCLPYSILKRQDCESLQSFIQTGNEKNRYSTQALWAGLIGTVAIGLGLVAWANTMDAQR